jgi:hypothetical protein
MEEEEEKTGHFDIDGNWVLEPQTAKIRNKLGPFWTLVDLLEIQRNDKSVDLSKNIDRCLNNCLNNRTTILKHLENIDNDIK